MIISIRRDFLVPIDESNQFVDVILILNGEFFRFRIRFVRRLLLDGFLLRRLFFRGRRLLFSEILNGSFGEFQFQPFFRFDASLVESPGDDRTGRRSRCSRQCHAGDTTADRSVVRRTGRRRRQMKARRC